LACQARPGNDHGQLGAEAGPLIGLARIGCLDLLRALFGGVIITAVVAAEIGIDADPDVRADRRPGASAIAEARAAGWLSIVESTDGPDVEGRRAISSAMGWWPPCSPRWLKPDQGTF
jgi:predicted dehydrogenase